MADPLSVTASIIAVLQLSSHVFQYLREVKGGTRARMLLHDELRNTISILEMLNYRIDDAEHGEPWTDSLLTLGSQHGPLDQFADTLRLLIKKLEPATKLKRTTIQLTWPFSEKDVKDLLGSLERQKTMFTLALQDASM